MSAPVVDALATPPPGLPGLALAMAAVAQRTRGDGGRPPLEELVDLAVEHLPAASAASVTMLRRGRFQTDAATGEVARRADAIQYDVGSGPCVDAVIDDSIYRTGHVEADERWPEFGRRVAAEVGVHSVLAVRLVLEGSQDAIACLNVFSDRVDAFDERDTALGLVLATQGSLLVTAQMAQERAENLSRALRSNREIGVAMGVLMGRHRLTRQQAFDVLRAASQDSNRKLSEIATEVADTGVVPVRRWPQA